MNKEELMQQTKEAEQTLNEQSEGAAVPEQELEEVAGGYGLPDSFSYSHYYSRCEIIYRHNVWSKDEYSFRGESITQTMAQKIVDTCRSQDWRVLTPAQWNYLKTGKMTPF